MRLFLLLVPIQLLLIKIGSALLLREQLLQLGLRLLLPLLDPVLLVVELRVDDGEGEIEEEEGADEDEGHEEEERVVGVDSLIHDHDVGPAFERDALKDSHHGP